MSDQNVAAQREVWLPVVGYEGLYEVSNLGRVRSHHRYPASIMTGGPGTCGMRYRRVTLRSSKRVHAKNVHVLVLEAFVGPRPLGRLALHRDGVVDNCELSNLYWGTFKDNSRDRITHGRSGRGERNPNAFLSPAQVADIRRSYRRGVVRQSDLARRYSVSQSHISSIILNRTWKVGTA